MLFDGCEVPIVFPCHSLHGEDPADSIYTEGPKAPNDDTNQILLQGVHVEAEGCRGSGRRSPLGLAAVPIGSAGSHLGQGEIHRATTATSCLLSPYTNWLNSVTMSGVARVLPARLSMRFPITSRRSASPSFCPSSSCSCWDDLSRK